MQKMPGGKAEIKKMKVTNYKITSDKLKKNARILMISDLHNSLTKEADNFLKTVKTAIPDMIVLAGDMINCLKNESDKNIETAGLINRLSEIAPVYYGVGNHERGTKEKVDVCGNAWEVFFKELDDKVQYLDNKTCVLPEYNIMFYGLDIPRNHYRRFVCDPLEQSAMQNLLGNPSDNYNILIAHHPDYYESYVKWGADLVLSGHNHGGLVRLPGLGGVLSPRLNLFPKYDYGCYEKDNTTMIVSSGLGAHSPKIRVNNKPEIVIIDLISEK